MSVSGVEGLVRQAWKLLLSVVRPLHHHLWQKPAEVRGTLWTISLWLRVLPAAYLLFERPVPVLVFAAGWGIAKLKGMKPKKHTRPLPYRRHR